MVTSYLNIDIALLGASKNGKKYCLIKAYFPSVWVTLNQQTNQNATLISTSDIYMFFESPRFNFAAEFNLSVTFNLSTLKL